MRILHLVISSCLVFCCGRSSDRGDDPVSVPTVAPAEPDPSLGTPIDVRGSVKSATGSQPEMAKWVVVFVERDTGVAKAADIDAAGNYAVSGLNINLPQTLVLLDPQYRFSSVVSGPGTALGNIQQYFTLKESTVPTIVHKGPTSVFAINQSAAYSGNIAKDSDFDGIPDGMEVTTGLVSPLPLAEEGEIVSTGFDLDSDGIFNEVDTDIDGDGIANWFDQDDDLDGVIDIFDDDSNADGVADSTQFVGELYFGRAIKYLSVQVSQAVIADGTSLSTTLLFTAKVADDYPVNQVTVRGSASLLEGSIVNGISPETGAVVNEPWDRSLRDDGASEDGGQGDLLYSRRVSLLAGKYPRSQQVVFVQVQSTSGGVTVVEEFPFMFPALTTSAISATYTVASRLLTLTGSPFENLRTFDWSIHVFDSASVKVFSSGPVKPATEGVVTTYTLPADIFEAGQTYTASVVASSLDRIPSYPSWIIRSAPIALSEQTTTTTSLVGSDQESAKKKLELPVK